ncbi:MAG: hypothetical protein IPK72_11025 [Candidatus Eisenbacteria bacterium]|nr:hypothetical protein [Candidatus Eisenbacteria bacterium]
MNLRRRRQGGAPPLVPFASALPFLLWCCTARPPALPAAAPDALPEAWLAPLRARSCPASLEANLRVRLTGADAAPVTLDGRLQWSAGDSLRVTGSYGPFRPVFVLTADPDSTQLLIHEEKSYWVLPRAPVDWTAPNPAAWARCIVWAACPAALFSRFTPVDRGRMESGLWTVEGALDGVPGMARFGIDPRTGSLVTIRLRTEGQTLLETEFLEPHAVGTAWVPSLLRVRVGDGASVLQIELLELAALDRTRFHPIQHPRPAGWRRVASGGLPASLSDPGKRLPPPR